VADTFVNALEALSDFEWGKYDNALLDVQMPEMSGFEPLPPNSKEDSSLKVCFFTAN